MKIYEFIVHSKWIFRSDQRNTKYKLFNESYNGNNNSKKYTKISTSSNKNIQVEIQM